MISASLSNGLPLFLAYLGLAALLVAAFSCFYVWITPQQEFTLIRAGNQAAVVAFLGTLFGYILPMVVAMRYGINPIDFVVWAIIAGLVQILAYFIARALMPDVSTRINQGEVVSGLWLGGVSALLGIVNAAAMTP